MKNNGRTKAMSLLLSLLMILSLVPGLSLTAWATDNAGTNTFKANFTPADTNNYNSVSGIDVNVTVGKAAGKAASKIFPGNLRLNRA